jgi:AmmeMemoRadiSam system protein B
LSATFLIRTLGREVPVLPVVVGPTPPSAVAILLSTLLDTAGTIAVVSSDLSHYLDRAQARERDTATAAAIVARRGEALHPADACGFYPLRGLLQHAMDRDHIVELLQLATSADTAGAARRVVGYGAFVLHENTAGARSSPRCQTQ